LIIQKITNPSSFSIPKALVNTSSLATLDTTHIQNRHRVTTDSNTFQQSSVHNMGIRKATKVAIVTLYQQGNFESKR
jgi:hypothetical protein